MAVEIRPTTEEMLAFTDEQLGLLGMDRRMSPTYLPGMDDPWRPYDKSLDTYYDPRMVNPEWLTDPGVQMDFLALDLSAFTIDDVLDSPLYWQELLGRPLSDAEAHWLYDFKLIEVQRENWGSPGIPEKGEPCI